MARLRNFSLLGFWFKLYFGYCLDVKFNSHLNYLNLELFVQ